MAVQAGIVGRDRDGVLLRGVDGNTFRFDPGAPCLEFAVTGGAGERAVFESLHSAADLRRWTQEALGLAVESVGDADLVAAKRLREAIWHCAEARAAARGLPGPHVATINRAAEQPPPIPWIDPEGNAGWAEPVTANQALSALARDAVALFTGALAGRIRQCEAADCRLLFADSSRPGRRRWCSMERCGNRAKVRAYRERRNPDHARSHAPDHDPRR